MTPTTRTAAAAQLCVVMVFSLLLTAMVLMIYMPVAPLMPYASLDGSWIYAMNEAVARGMAIGREVNFTFGPYAAIYTYAFHPGTDTLALGGGLLLGLSFGGACLLLARGRAWWWWPPLLGVALATTAVVHSRDAIFYAHPLLVGTAVLARWQVTDPDSAARRPSLWWVALLFAPLGLLPLIKGSFVAVAAGVVVLSAGLLWWRQQRRAALLCVATPLLTMAVLWALAGQALVDLPAYFWHMLPIISGYTEGMSLNGWRREIRAFLLVTAALLMVVALQRRFRWQERAFHVSLLGLLLFVVFKSGFVRHDSGHSILAPVTLLLATISLAAVVRARWALPLVAAAACTWWYFMGHYSMPVWEVRQSVHFLTDKGPKGLARRVTDPGALRREFDATVQKLRQQAALPVLPGSVDIYPHHQAALIASGNQWTPRPVLQSYSAYTESLAEMNRDFLLGPRAPEHLFFGMEPIDQRYPSLDDGASWPALLTRYKPSAWAGDFLVLERLPAQAARSPLPAAGPAQSHPFGDRVDVPATAGSDQAMWVELDIRPTLPGALLATLYKPVQLRIEVTLADGSRKNYRLLSRLARGGFLLSPLVETSAEFGFLYGGGKHLAGKVVKSFTVAPLEGRLHGWQPRYSVVFRALPLPADSGLRPPGMFEGEIADVAGLAIVPAAQCLGSIDVVNGVSPSTPGLSAQGPLKVEGWLDDTISPLYLVLQDAQGLRRFMTTRRTSRLDVANALKRPELALSGWSTALDTGALDGPYTLGLALRRNGRLEICPQFASPLALRGVAQGGTR